MGHHHHDHHHHHHHNRSVKNIKLAFILNFSFAIVEFIGGIWTNSSAIQSDAIHDLGDSFALAFALLLEKSSTQKSTNRHSYGLRRLSIFSGVLTALILVFGAGYIFATAIPKLFNPTNPNVTGMIWLAILGLAVNGFAAIRLQKGLGENEKLLSWHLWEDVMTWGAVLIIAVVMKFIYLPILDPILSILIAIITLIGVYRAIKPSIYILAQATPIGVDLEKMTKQICTIDQVIAVHDFHCWSLDGQQHVASLHVVVQDNIPVKTLHQIKISIREIISADHKIHTTLEIETKDESEYCKFHECV